MIYIPDNIKSELKISMKSPQGTVSTTITFEEDFYDINIPGGVIFENVAGGHYFRLERTDNQKLKFYHSSPGTGTRLAITDISQSISSKQIKLFLVWSPNELRMSIGPMGVTGGELMHSTEESPDRAFKVISGDQVIEVGGPGIQVMGLRISQGNKPILDSTAIESWNETIQAIDVLTGATSKDGYMFNVVKSNFIVVSLVTGIETYCKRRIQELENEGLVLDYHTLAEKSNGTLTKDKILAETTNYFQSLDSMKDIWKHLVSIKVSMIDPDTWQYFKTTLFPHRHIVVHVHSLRAEMKHVDGQIPLFVTNELPKARALCENFIKALHKETLQLDRQKT